MYNVIRPDGSPVNRYPLNELQARAMVKICKLNYGFTPTISKI